METARASGREGSRMSTIERRIAARANQRAAAFIRFQMLGDHEAMHIVLTESGESDTARLAFVTALASIAGSVAGSAFGREGALRYLQSVAESSAALSDAEDIDRFFE
jgi:membrane protein YqaA with SNARE-associated domain